MLSCKNIAVERSGQRVLEAGELQLAAGELIGLTGPNGCGKTTLLEALVGAIPLASGQVVFDGRTIESLPVHVRAQAGIRLIPDRNMVFANLSVQEHLQLCRQNSSALLDINEFAPFRLAQKAGTLSGGEKRILATACALHSLPRLLLADEFSEGLQPGVVQKMLRQVRKLCERGAIAILVLHSEKFAAEEKIPAYTVQHKRLVRLS